MVVTIYKGYEKNYVLLGSRDERFHKEWGSVVRLYGNSIYEQLEAIAKWANNELGEEILFEVD